MDFCHVTWQRNAINTKVVQVIGEIKKIRFVFILRSSSVREIHYLLNIRIFVLQIVN